MDIYNLAQEGPHSKTYSIKSFNEAAFIFQIPWKAATVLYHVLKEGTWGRGKGSLQLTNIVVWDSERRLKWSMVGCIPSGL